MFASLGAQLQLLGVCGRREELYWGRYETMSATKKLMNQPGDVVKHAVEGMLLTNSNLAVIAGCNVLVRKDIAEYKASHVSLISGGGSGHEPAHGGYVGRGMLTAAVLGNVFASPSVSHILAAIRCVTGPAGTLLIVKNYTGDRLNFGMAMERAKAEGLQVRMVIVADDCALPEGKGITGGRGVAGTVFVHKIAGACAEAGASLQDVHAAAASTAQSMGSMGVALTTCTVPGTPPSTRLDDPTKYEVGLGIHGEPGREVREFVPGGNHADVVAETLVDAVIERKRFATGPGGHGQGLPVAVMLNNLGSLPLIEMYIVARRVVKCLVGRGLAPVRVYVGSFMTALEMSGLSLTILPASGVLLAALDAPTLAPAWVPASPLSPTPTMHTLPVSAGKTDGDAASLFAAMGKRGGRSCPGAMAIAAAICRVIVEQEPELTRCDAICGDGDCGVVMKAGALKVSEGLDMASTRGAADSPEADSAALCNTLADLISASMGGTSGALLELFFRAAANSLTGSARTGLSAAAEWASALQAGVDAMMFYGGAGVGMRTMLDALVPACAALSAGATATQAAGAAEEGMESTKAMGSLAGRSNYVNEELMRGVPDPGALAVALAFRAAAAVIEL